MVKLLQVKNDALNANSMNELTNLSIALRNLQVLKNNFKIVVSITEYLNVSIFIIITLCFYPCDFHDLS